MENPPKLSEELLMNGQPEGQLINLKV